MSMKNSKNSTKKVVKNLTNCTKKIAILFSGSGTNMENIIKKLHGKCFNGVKIEVSLLICNKKDALGIKRAKNLGFDTRIIEHGKYDSRDEFDAELVRVIKETNVDLVVLAGFMRVLGEQFCKEVKAINLHPSILPLFKGAHAIEESWQSDMQVGGISIHWVSAELDGGKIIAQKTFPRKNSSFEKWEEKTHELEHELLPKTIVEILCKK